MFIWDYVLTYYFISNNNISCKLIDVNYLKYVKVYVFTTMIQNK